MQRSLFIFLSFILLTSITAKSQSLDSLSQLKGYTFPVYYSAQNQPKTKVIAGRIEKAMAFHQQLLQFSPAITLVILSAADWDKYIAQPVVYGMPHYNNKDKRLIVAAEDNPFWRSFVPPLDKLPEPLRESIKHTYTTPEGKLSMQAFFDLLAIHELGHAFHIQGGLTMQRSWMGELYANILLHTYIAEQEPALLPALTLFPKMVVAAGAKEFKYTSLADVQEHYNELGQQYPKNYGWYQCRWHAGAAGIYDKSGKQACKKLWDAFKTQKEKLTDDALINFLTIADEYVGALVKNWDKETLQ